LDDVTGPRHPFRFGVEYKVVGPAAEWIETARRLEDAGYSSLTMSDHLDHEPGPIAALAALSGATSQLRLGTTVLANDFRHPVVMAQEAATVDLLSGGRLELGLGAGWDPSDYRRAGIDFDPPKVRIERLGEAIQIVKSFFDGSPVTFSGKYYHIEGLTGYPKPVQRPRPPLMIGGGGRRILSLAGREADIVSVGFDLGHGAFDDRAIRTSTHDATTRKVGWVRSAAGDRAAALELSVQIVAAAVTEDREDCAHRLASSLGVTALDILDSPQFLVGTVEEIVDDLIARRERLGLSYIVLRPEAAKPMAPVVQRLTGT
jgi:probable F420-dependent oxidoreductase